MLSTVVSALVIVVGAAPLADPLVYINGEVRNNGSYAYRDGMTVRDLIAAAGGLTDRGNPDAIRVIRRIEGRVREVSVTLDTPVSQDDVIMVGKRGQSR